MIASLGRLNGWQRLWVLLSLLWGTVVLLGGCLLWPTLPTTSPLRVVKSEPLPDASLDSKWLDTPPTEMVAASIRARYPGAYDDLTNEQLEAALVGRVIRDAPVADERRAALHRAYRESEGTEQLETRLTGLSDVPTLVKADLWDLKAGRVPDTVWTWEANAAAVALTARRWRFVGAAVAVWLLPAFAVYALGLGIAWVRCGFARTR